MPIAAWNDSYKTGHTPVDNQHQELFRMVNALHDAMVDGKGREVLNATLQKLAAYTLSHFKTEEALMSSIHYPAMRAHKSKHEALSVQVKDLATKYASGEAVLTTTLSSFLSDWLRHHIKEDDMALIQYMKSKHATAAGHK